MEEIIGAMSTQSS